MKIKFRERTDAQMHADALYMAAQDLVLAMESSGPLQMHQRLSIARLSLTWLTHEERLRYFKLERAVILAARWEPRRPAFMADYAEPLNKITRGDL